MNNSSYCEGAPTKASNDYLLNFKNDEEHTKRRTHGGRVFSEMRSIEFHLNLPKDQVSEESLFEKKSYSITQ